MKRMADADLFAVDPAQFVAERDRIAKALRAEGKRDEAAAVRALRRPTVPTWALNQVARRHPAEIAELADAAARARDAQDEVLAGADGSVLREALAERRSALRDVIRRAGAVVDDSGRSGDGQERAIESTLQRVIDSGDLVDALRRGELTDVADGSDGADDDVSSMFQLPGGVSPGRAPATSTAKPKPKGKPGATAPANATAEAEARTELETKRAVAVAEAEVERRTSELDDAEGELAEAEMVAADAEAELAAAQERAKEARAAVTAASVTRDKAEAALQDARAALERVVGPG